MLSMQRSATTTFCTEFNGAGFHCAYEMFNFGHHKPGQRTLPLVNMTEEQARQAPALYVRRARDYYVSHPEVHFLEHPFAYSRPPRADCLFLFKVFKDSCANDCELLPSIVEAADAVVIMERANTTAQYLSWRYATTTGCFQTGPTTNETSEWRRKYREEKCSKPKDPTLHDDWPQFRRDKERWFERASAVVHEVGKPLTRWTMEQFLQTHPWSPTTMKMMVSAPDALDAFLSNARMCQDQDL